MNSDLSQVMSMARRARAEALRRRMFAWCEALMAMLGAHPLAGERRRMIGGDR